MQCHNCNLHLPSPPLRPHHCLTNTAACLLHPFCPNNANMLALCCCCLDNATACPPLPRLLSHPTATACHCHPTSAPPKCHVAPLLETCKRPQYTQCPPPAPTMPPCKRCAAAALTMPQHAHHCCSCSPSPPPPHATAIPPVPSQQCHVVPPLETVRLTQTG
jgi:hypothetical protein